MKSRMAFLLILTLLHAATISGSVYSFDSFEKINGTLVKLEGKTSYQVFSADGDYSIDAEPGDYNLTALHMREGRIDYLAYEKITVSEESQNFDIVLFSPDFFESDELPSLDVEFLQQGEGGSPDHLWLLFVLIAIAAGAYALSRMARKPKAPQSSPDEDGKKVLRMLSENEGRMEQKELREILKFSESKMSLLLTELEVSGHIKRFKKGRENIIKLKRGVE